MGIDFYDRVDYRGARTTHLPPFRDGSTRIVQPDTTLIIAALQVHVPTQISVRRVGNKGMPGVVMATYHTLDTLQGTGGYYIVVTGPHGVHVVPSDMVSVEDSDVAPYRLIEQDGGGDRTVGFDKYPTALVAQGISIGLGGGHQIVELRRVLPAQIVGQIAPDLPPGSRLITNLGVYYIHPEDRLVKEPNDYTRLVPPGGYQSHEFLGFDVPLDDSGGSTMMMAPVR